MGRAFVLLQRCSRNREAAWKQRDSVETKRQRGRRVSVWKHRQCEKREAETWRPARVKVPSMLSSKYTAVPSSVTCPTGVYITATPGSPVSHQSLRRRLTDSRFPWYQTWCSSVACWEMRVSQLGSGRAGSFRHARANLLFTELDADTHGTGVHR